MLVHRRPSRAVSIAVGVAALSTALGAAPSQAIYNGERAPFGPFEFMVSLRPPKDPKHHLCGGTLIAPNVVLTAAHCLGGGNPKRLTAIVGRDKPDWRDAHGVPITGYRVPRGFSIKSSNRNDIALLQLARRQGRPVVDLARDEPGVDGRVTTVGWGCTDRPPGCERHPTHLQMLRQRVVSDSRCDRSTFWNPPAHARTSICARGSNAMSSFGDSGGPLLVGTPAAGYTQVGVVSLLTDKPGRTLNAYTSVPELRGWVRAATAALSGG